jgi:ubiquinone/menaquinone biosynthesis C-methylase UbiE
MTARQKREREFFDEYWSRYEEHAEVNLDPIAGQEHRPWNPYWYVFDVAKKLYEAGARNLLDFGCGGGTNAAIFATLGYEVSGFDVSPQCIEIAKRVAAQHNLSHRTHFSVQVSENLQYPDEFFDVVAGIDILHHIEIAPSVAECMRVLKPGGVAVFREFVQVPAFDRIRNTALVRFFFPNEKNLDPSDYITEDERKMTDEDVAVIRGLCPTVIEKRFYVFARLDRLLRRPGDRSASYMEKLDYWLCNRLAPLNKLGGSVVLELHKNSSSDSSADQASDENQCVESPHIVPPRAART